jgi:hypothetical protein
VGELKPAARNARTHSAKQLQQITASITEFGFIAHSDEFSRRFRSKAATYSDRIQPGIPMIPAVWRCVSRAG